ncbi:MAG TPA: GNAT family N-acetyltransferase [Gemmatimonadaceae bacterium]|nr:GNAT family N-acetyltransferase [Gemmatimonadaceae bacterium]
MNAIRVDRLLPEHRPRIEAIVRATGVFSDDEVGVALEVFDAEDDYEFLGAFHDGDLVGYVCFGPTPSTDRTFDVYWIAVHPDAQRTGAGAALMAAVEQELESRRARMVVIETSSRDDYAPTRRFYQKHGYQESARLRDFFAPGDDRVVFTRRIAVFEVLPHPA